MQVETILRSPTDSAKSVCQCWSPDGSVFATAHDRRVTFYSAKNDFCVQLTVQVRFSVASMDIARLSSGGSRDSDDSDITYLLAAGTAFGAYLYSVELSTQTSNQKQENGDDHPTTSDTSSITLPPLASAYEETPMCFVKFSHDGATIAMGSVDGRLYVRALTRTSDASHLTSKFGTQVFAKVLAAPRVTSISFSPCSRKVAVATRKGNVYVLTRASSLSGEWQLHLPCKELSSKPKPVASCSSSAATAMQTLMCWWTSEVLVVASRAANYRLEMIDVKSGKLLHTLQIDTRPTNSDELSSSSTVAATDDQLLTGVCCVQLANGHTLVCHDTNSNLSVVSWPLLEMEESSSGSSLQHHM